MKVPLYQVDAFTDRPFHGNPAAVCVLAGVADSAWMQGVAAEMNLAETAFVWPAASDSDSDSHWNLRWFTPLCEVDLCGHATLAAAHALTESGRNPDGGPIAFHSNSGVLRCVPANDQWTLDFPALPVERVEPPADLAAAWDLTHRFCGLSRFDYLVEFESAEALRSLAPDMARLAKLDSRGVIATSAGEGNGYDFLSRYFAPAVGIPEDPVTGSAHCVLAPYWSGQLDKVEMVGFQASPRGGVVGVRVNGARVELRGQAVTVLRGELDA